MRRVLPTLLAAAALPIFVLLAASGSAAQNIAVGAKANEIHTGNDLFLHNCMQCHAVIESQSSFGPNLHGEMKKPHPKKSVDQVEKLIENGKGKMPPFKDKLSVQEKHDLIAYMRTL